MARHSRTRTGRDARSAAGGGRALARAWRERSPQGGLRTRAPALAQAAAAARKARVLVPRGRARVVIRTRGSGRLTAPSRCRAAFRCFARPCPSCVRGQAAGPHGGARLRWDQPRAWREQTERPRLPRGRSTPQSASGGDTRPRPCPAPASSVALPTLLCPAGDCATDTILVFPSLGTKKLGATSGDVTKTKRDLEKTKKGIRASAHGLGSRSALGGGGMGCGRGDGGGGAPCCSCPTLRG